MVNKNCLLLLTVVLLASCSQKNDGITILTEKSNVIQADNALVEFDTEPAVVGKNSKPLISGNRIFITDVQSHDTIISVFDADTKKFIGKIAPQGPGPDEITVPGSVVVSEDGKKILIFDNGQLKVAQFDIDSALSVTDYRPLVRQSIDKTSFPSHYCHINDTLGFGRAITVHKDRSYSQALCKYNLSNGKMIDFGAFDRNPEDKSMICVSRDKGIVVEGFISRDLMVIYDFDGNVVKEIHGPQFSVDSDKNKTFYTQLFATDKYILANNVQGKDRREGSLYGNCLEVYDHDGNYIATIDIGIPFWQMAYNNRNGELLLATQSEMQFATLNLEEVLSPDFKNKPKEARIKKAEAKAVADPVSINNSQPETCQESTVSKTETAVPTPKAKLPRKEAPVDFVKPPGTVYTTLDFGTIQSKDGAYGSMCMKNIGPDSLYITKVEFSNPEIKGKLSYHKMKPGTILGLEVWVAKDYPIGSLNESVKIYFKDTEEPRILYIKGMVE